MINFNFISYVLFGREDLNGMVWYKKKKTIDNLSNVKLKLFKNRTKPIRSLVHPCTPLYTLHIFLVTQGLYTHVLHFI